MKRINIILFLGLTFCLIACGTATNNPTPPTTPMSIDISPITPTLSIMLTTPSATDVAPHVSDRESPTPPFETPSRLSQSSALRWITAVPCRAPCIEGIVPGRTSATEAMTLLQKQPTIESLTKTVGPEPTIGRIRWDWSDGGHAILYFNTDDSHQVIYVATYFFNKTIAFNQIIKEYGEPSHVIATAMYGADGPIYTLRLLYLDKGFEISPNNPNAVKPVLDGNLSIRSPRFFATGKDGFIASFQGYAHAFDLAVPWQGMHDFDFYCQDNISCRVLRDPASTPVRG